MVAIIFYRYINMYVIIVIFIFLVISYLYFYFAYKDKEGFDPNLVDIIPIQISSGNDVITVPNKINGFQDNAIIFDDLNVANTTVHKGRTFLNPVGEDLNPDIDLAIGDKKTGFNRDDVGIVSFWGNGQKIGSYGTDGMTLQKNLPMEFGKDVANKNVDAGKIFYNMNSLDIVGAGNEGTNRKVRIQDNLDIGNNLLVPGATELNETILRGNTQIVGNKKLEFGANEAKTNPNSGTIIYKTNSDTTSGTSSLDPNALNIVGAETGSTRKIHLWDDVEVDSNLRVKGSIRIGTDEQYWNIKVQPDGTLHFLYKDTSPGDVDNDKGHITVTTDGDIRLAKSYFPGMITEKLKYINENPC
jgi:hypothetical protein